MNTVAKQFEPCYFGNGWGNYINIENYEYNMLDLKLKENDYDNNNNLYIEDKSVKSLIVNVSSTTFVTLLLSYFVYRNI